MQNWSSRLSIAGSCCPQASDYRLKLSPDAWFDVYVHSCMVISTFSCISNVSHFHHILHLGRRFSYVLTVSCRQHLPRMRAVSVTCNLECRKRSVLLEDWSIMWVYPEILLSLRAMNGSVLPSLSMAKLSAIIRSLSLVIYSFQNVHISFVKILERYSFVNT